MSLSSSVCTQYVLSMTLRHCNIAPLHLCNFSTLQLFNIATLLLCKIGKLKNCNIARSYICNEKGQIRWFHLFVSWKVLRVIPSLDIFRKLRPPPLNIQNFQIEIEIFLNHLPLWKFLPVLCVQPEWRILFHTLFLFCWISAEFSLCLILNECQMMSINSAS